MAELRNPKHESFAHYVSLGEPLYRAYALAYGRNGTDESLRGNASRLWNHLSASKEIRARVHELMKKKRKAAELTMQRCLDDMLDTADLARAAGQYAASITAQKALAGELFDLFRDKREIDVNIEIRDKNKMELRALLVEQYGEETTPQIWATWNAPRLIEGNATELEADTEAQDNAPDCTIHGPVAQPDSAQNSDQNDAARFDTQRESAPRRDLERLALQSLANSKPPKV
jgi:hypothetical protein